MIDFKQIYYAWSNFFIWLDISHPIISRTLLVFGCLYEFGLPCFFVWQALEKKRQRIAAVQLWNDTEAEL